MKLAKEFKSPRQIIKQQRLVDKIIKKSNIELEYKLGDLYCGELSRVFGKEVNKIVDEGASDITFCLQPLAIGIFT